MSDSKPPVEDIEPQSKTRNLRWAGVLLRLILAGLAGTLIGVVVYYSAAGSIPYLEQRIFGPLQENSSEIREARSTQEAAVALLSDLQAELEDRQSGMEELQMELPQLSEDYLYR